MSDRRRGGRGRVTFGLTMVAVALAALSVSVAIAGGAEPVADLPTAATNHDSDGVPDAGLDQLALRVVSSRSDMVTDGDALVELRLPAGSDGNGLALSLDGTDVTGAFAATDGRHLRGLVDGLTEGANELRAALPGYPDATLFIVDHPRTGPVFSGPQQEPFICQTEEWGLGAPTDEDCSLDTSFSYLYMQQGGDWAPLADPSAEYPADGAMTTTTEGDTVPYAVRVERGTINRAIYAIAVLADVGPGAESDQPGSGWNHKLIFNFGGGCKAGYTQGEPENYAPTGNVGKGYATAESSLNVFANRCSDAVSAETLMMIKEHFVENYGEPRFTIGSGGSGGAMAQYMIDDNYPGLLDGSVVSHSFADNGYASNALMDCRVIDLYFNTGPAGWTGAQKRAVKGPNQTNGCAVIWAAFGRNFFNPSFCPSALPAEQVYDAATNPTGARCTVMDGNINVWGMDPDTGFVRRPVDNVGVTYGLKALNAGTISVDQFLDLNENTGGLDSDNNTTSNRIEANPEALRIAYEQGQLISGGAGLSYTPVIDNRSANNDNQATNPHHIVNALSVRDRIIRANGDAGPHVIWTSPSGGVGDVVATMDEWLEGIISDHSDASLREKALAARPEEATDRCFTADGTVIAEEPASVDSGVCGTTYPSYSLPRIVAGGPVANDVIKCQLKPIDYDDYAQEFSAEQKARLESIFPDGVCDYSRLGVEQTISRDTWRVYAGSYEQDDRAPDTAIGSRPREEDAPGKVAFTFSADEMGARFECSLDGAAYRACASPVEYQDLGDGQHEFSVRSVDLAGNADASPATAAFYVGERPPKPPIAGLRLQLRSRGYVEAGRAVFARVKCPREACSVRARAVFKLPRRHGRRTRIGGSGTLRTKRLRLELKAGEGRRIKLKLARREARKLMRRSRSEWLRRGTKVQLRAHATDADGDSAKRRMHLELRR